MPVLITKDEVPGYIAECVKQGGGGDNPGLAGCHCGIYCFKYARTSWTSCCHLPYRYDFRCGFRPRVTTRTLGRCNGSDGEHLQVMSEAAIDGECPRCLSTYLRHKKRERKRREQMGIESPGRAEREKEQLELFREARERQQALLEWK